jgi:hypothetical protein
MLPPIFKDGLQGEEFGKAFVLPKNYEFVS